MERMQQLEKLDGFGNVQMVEVDRPQPAADQMLIRHDLWSLIKGRFVARSLTLSQPVLYVTEEMPAHDGPGMFNYDYLRLASDPSRTLPQHLPEIFIRQGRIIRGEYQNGEYQLLITMEVNGKFNEKIDQPNHYSFALSQGGLAGDTGGQLNGSLDLETLNVRVEGERFGFETDQAQALPLRLRRWREMMEPKGEISAFNVSYDSENQIFRAMIEVRGISLTLPYFGEADDRGDGPDESARQFRLTDVAGSFLIERVFNIPGVALLAFEAIQARDFPIVLGFLVISSLLLMVGNLVSDLAVALVDPRVRFE